MTTLLSTPNSLASSYTRTLATSLLLGPGYRRTVATSWAYSSRTHRVLIAISTYFQLARYLTARGPVPFTSYGVTRSTNRCTAAGSNGPLALKARGRPGGEPPGPDRQRRGVHMHPGRAAYREDRGRRRPRPRRCAAARSWPPAPGIPHRFAQGKHGRASGQTRLSLPPRTDLTPLGQKSNGCCRDLSGIATEKYSRRRRFSAARTARGPVRHAPGRRRRARRRSRCPGGCRCASR